MNMPQSKHNSLLLAVVIVVCLCAMETIANSATAKPDSKADIVNTKVARTVKAQQTYTMPAARRTGRLDAGAVSRAWKPGDAIRFVPKRSYATTPLGDPINPTSWTIDPLLQKQDKAQRGPGTFGIPSVNIAGQGFTGFFPPDTSGDVGPTNFMQMVNAPGGSDITAWDKTGALDFGPVGLAGALGSGVCATGGGDPIVLFDEFADRWILSEFSDVSNTLCVYVSQTSDAGGTYFSYQFTAPNFPDYPKYAVWPSAYIVTSNEPGASPVYVLDRAAMLTGAVVAFQRLTAPDLAGFGFQALTPIDVDGPLSFSTTNALLMRHRDDEVHNPGSNDPTRDFLELYEVNVDFVGGSTLTGPTNIAVSEFDSELCGLTSFMCFPQPNLQQLDPLREVVMWRASFRDFDTHRSIVGNLTTDINGSDIGGVRWFELINAGFGWVLRQDGTIGTTADHRWMGSVAMDKSGNIATGYSIVSTLLPTDMVYAGRLDDTTTGGLVSQDNPIVSGGGSQSNERWGDYSSMSIDPSDGCTFWHTNEYVTAANQWDTQIAAFRFDDCGGSPMFCGNAVLDPGEECDDGNYVDGDGCRADCTLEPILTTCVNEEFESGIGAGFTVFNTGPQPLDWGVTNDGVCFSNNLSGPGIPPAPNVTGGSGEAACIDSDQAGTGVVESYLCGPVIVPNGPLVELVFQYNYQVFSATVEDDFSVLIGTLPPNPGTISSYITELIAPANQGGFASLPGAFEVLDLSNYAGQGIHYCIRYSGDFDWYAQVDNVTLRAENGCAAVAPDINIEKLTNGVDADDPNAGDAPVIAPTDLVTWEYSVTNTGNVTLTDVSVTDDQLGTICVEPFLAPGQNISCSFSQNAQDLSTTVFTTVIGNCAGASGSVLYQNIATVSALTPGGMPALDSDVSHYCNPPIIDTDGDGVFDTADNCLLVPNATQIDADSDDIGNACDPDYDQNCAVNFLDVSIFAAAFNTIDPVVDLDGNGSVNFLDLFILQGFFNMPPGPSGIPSLCP